MCRTMTKRDDETRNVQNEKPIEHHDEYKGSRKKWIKKRVISFLIRIKTQESLDRHIVFCHGLTILSISKTISWPPPPVFMYHYRCCDYRTTTTTIIQLVTILLLVIILYYYITTRYSIDTTFTTTTTTVYRLLLGIMLCHVPITITTAIDCFFFLSFYTRCRYVQCIYVLHAYARLVRK